MRIEDFLNQGIITKRLSSYQKQQQPDPAAFTMAQKSDSVSISEEARAAQQAGGYFTESASNESQAKLAFKEYMDKATGRVPQAPKTPEEKMKELVAKLKKLQSDLSETVTDNSLSDSVRTSRMNTLNAQINAVHAQMAELGEEMAEAAV